MEKLKNNNNKNNNFKAEGWMEEEVLKTLVEMLSKRSPE